jgi:DNA ligase-1
LGLVAEKSKSSQTTVDKFFVKKVATPVVPLSLREVFELLTKIARTKGNDSANEKERLLEGVMRKA